MYESFFGMEHTPFVRDVPADKLYESNAFQETLGRLAYVADRQKFAVVTADPGCGKSTLIRRFYEELPKSEYIVLYLSDSKLTPRWFYKGLLDQLGLESKFYRGDSKRQLQQQIEIIRGVQHKKVVCILDEAHLLEKETLEEFRFLLLSLIENNRSYTQSEVILNLARKPVCKHIFLARLRITLITQSAILSLTNQTKEVYLMKTVHEAVRVILDELKSTLSESSFISERRDYMQLLKMADERKTIFPTQELFDAFAADDHGHCSRRKKHAMVLKRLDKEADVHALRPDLRPYNKIPLPSKEETEALFSESTYPVPPGFDIGYLIVRAREELHKLGHKPHSIDDDYMDSMHTIHWFFISHGQTAFDCSLMNEFLLHNDGLYASGKIHRSRWYNDRKAAYILKEIALKGKYSWKYISSPRFMAIDPGLELLRQNFIKYLTSNNLSKDTIKNYDQAFRCVICFSGSSCLESLSAFSSEDILCITQALAERYDKSCLHSMYGRIRKVLQFLYDTGITSHNWAGSLVPPAVLQGHVAGYFSDEAESSLYACLDMVSFRDRAICLLAADLGLRDYDICHLKFEQIDWQENKLYIVQHKNDEPLVLPLIAEVGNALMDYILNERPKPEQKNPYVFLTSVAPYRRLEHAYRPCRNLLELSGAEPVQGKHKGSHLYRDNLVHRMLQNKVTHQVITDSLGHKSKEADKSYITMEPEMLRQCALGLGLIGPHCWKEGGLHE